MNEKMCTVAPTAAQSGWSWQSAKKERNSKLILSTKIETNTIWSQIKRFMFIAHTYARTHTPRTPRYRVWVRVNRSECLRELNTIRKPIPWCRKYTALRNDITMWCVPRHRIAVWYDKIYNNNNSNKLLVCSSYSWFDWISEYVTIDI